MHIPKFGTLHIVPPELDARIQQMAPPMLHDATDYDSPDFDENNFDSYKLIGGFVLPAEAMTVALGDDSFSPAHHRNHTITSGIFKGTTCLMDGEEEDRLVERTRDIAGSANSLGMEFEDYWTLRNKRLDEECTRLIQETMGTNQANFVDVETGVSRLKTYITGRLNGTIERLALYRD